MVENNSKESERRRHKRYVADFKVYFDTPYDVEKKLTFTIRDESDQEKYLAFSRNVSTEGMCFVSHKQLQPGALLKIEVYLESGLKPVLMDGEVRWCRSASLHEENKTLFDSGIRLLKLNGASVFDSIHYNEKKNAEWSNVLEIIFGRKDNLV